MSTAEVITAIANTVTAVATLGAVLVAGAGLRAWKKELQGRADFDTARALARDTYSLREAIAGYRSPFWSSAEFPEGDMSRPEGYAAMFQKRWRAVSEALTAFDSTVLEAEALWGASVLAGPKRLRHCVLVVYVATEAFVEDKKTGGENFKSDPDFGTRTREEIAGSADSQTNAMSKEILSAVSAIEESLKPHLSRG